MEALGQEPSRPASAVGLEQLPQRVMVVNNDVEEVKALLVAVVGR